MEPASEEATPAPAPASAILPQPQSQSQLSSPQDDKATAKADTQNVSSNGNAREHIENDETNHPVPDTGNPDETTLPHTDSGASSSKSRPVSSVIPPFWQRHERSVSRASLSSLAQSRIIRLEDHTADPDSETSRGLWARSVAIDDHVVVQGKSGVGSYVVWNCTIQTLDGGPIVVRIRYSEFDDLRQRLESAFPHARNALPALPPKSVLFKFRPKFLESRRVGLEYFLNCVLLNPEFSSSPIVKDFLFGRLS
ncbi:Putative PX domain protein [Penicillium brasilianum]|uniref:Endosomal/vacuolar adapter protein YPT35 n=1 Tax=Penicillium brasilianum TaxID=104259 RepID=A0A0F7TP20_PENBI|nr:Putative PX domain protein [Penicillium brasilianum]